MFTKFFLAAAVTSALFATPAKASVASTTTAYSFVGTCVDCTGTGVGTLTLRNYFGGNLGNTNFVSFTYASNLVSANIPSSDPINLSGTLSTLPGTNGVFMTDGAFELITSTSGYWCIGNNCALDYGFASVWSQSSAAVPEPASMAILGSALIGFATTRRRR